MTAGRTSHRDWPPGQAGRRRHLLGQVAGLHGDLAAPSGHRDRSLFWCDRAHVPPISYGRRRRRFESARPDAGLGAPRALHRPQGPEAGRGAVRQGGTRACARPRPACLAPAARAGRERELEPDRDSRRDPDRAQGEDRRRRDHVAAELGAPGRGGGEEGDGRQVGRRSPRLARRPSSPSSREHGGPRKGEGRRGRGPARRPLGRRDHLRLGRDRGGGARLLAAREGRDDLERLRLRRLRRAGLHADRPLPDHAHGQLLRQARPPPVPDRARRVGPRRPGALPRRLPLLRPRVGGRTRARRPAGADPVRARARRRSSSSATPRRCCS